MQNNTEPRHPRRFPFAIATAGTGIAMFASAVPSPLYPVYQHIWHLAPSTVTVVFAVYVGTLLLGLLTLGSLSDHIGRRPVALVALAVLAASMVMFAVAGSAVTLILARGVEGLATGAAMSVFSAAAIDSQPSRPAGSTATGIVPILGLGVGIATSAVIVQFAPDPRSLIYVITTAALVVLAVAASRTLSSRPLQPRPASAAAVARLLVPHVHVPPETRAAFRAGIPALIAVWALGGLLLALGTSIIPRRLHITGTAEAGMLLSVFFFAAAAAAPLTAGRRHAIGTRTAAITLGAGLIILTAGTALSSPVVYTAGLAIGGVGFATTYAGILASLTHVAPHRRGVLFAAVYVASYLAYGIPVVIAGITADRFGLWATTVGYSAFVLAAIILAVVQAPAAVTPLPAVTVDGTPAVPCPRPPHTPHPPGIN